VALPDSPLVPHRLALLRLQPGLVVERAQLEQLPVPALQARPRFAVRLALQVPLVLELPSALLLLQPVPAEGSV
jgi:hypothetical protein